MPNARPVPRVVRATIESLAGTGQVAEARELLAQDSEKLAPEDRAALEALLAP